MNSALTLFPFFEMFLWGSFNSSFWGCSLFSFLGSSFWLTSFWRCSMISFHDDNNEVSNVDFNTMMDKKLNEFKSSIISELIKNMKVLIQSEFWYTIQKYKNQLEEMSSIVSMLQQQVTNLKQENSNLQKSIKIDRQDLEKYCEENEQYSRRLCLIIKNMKKQENESSDQVLE